MTDRVDVALALTERVAELGWRVEKVQALPRRVTLVLVPGLAKPNSERNRWPDEPEEGEEPTQEERTREWAPDWDVGVDTSFLGAERAD